MQNFEIDVTKKDQEQTEDSLKLLDDELSFIEFEDMLIEDSYYIKEKRKGGENSYQKYKPLRDKVKCLCEEELSNQSYSSATQLCETVAGRIVDENPELLRSFEPHKTHAHSGNDWKRPTFYLWCNDVYKGLQNTSTLIE